MNLDGSKTNHIIAGIGVCTLAGAVLYKIMSKYINWFEFIYGFNIYMINIYWYNEIIFCNTRFIIIS